MNGLWEMLAGPWEQAYFLKAWLGASMVAIVCGVVGSLVVLRRMAFLGDALSHAMIAGVAGGYLFMKVLFGIEASAPAMLLGSLITAVITVALIGLVSKVSRIKEDAVIGIMYTGIFALGVVFVSIFRNLIHIDLMHFIMGDVLGISDGDLWASAITAALVLTVILLFFRHFQLVAFDPVMAASIGISVLLVNYALTVSVSLVVVSAVSMVGVILVVGLLITPAATAYLLSDRLDRMMTLAALFGLTSVTGGLYLCEWLDSSGGGAIMLFSTAQFAVVLAVAPRYGLLARWLRLRRMVPQSLMEDILRQVQRGQGKPVTIHSVVSSLRQYGNVRRAAGRLVADGLLDQVDDGLLLTEAGTTEANRITRAHRLWEAFLDHVGERPENIHDHAMELEHVRQGDAIRYLDELLGQPGVDPHGQEIPAEAPPRADGLIRLSRLPWGTDGVVRITGETDTGRILAQEEHVRVEAFPQLGSSLMIIREDGTKVIVPRDQADTILVQPQ